jgi:hypothetical protein
MTSNGTRFFGSRQDDEPLEARVGHRQLAKLREIG